MQHERMTLKRTAFLRALGAAVRARRLRLKLTGDQLAMRLGESPGAIARLEAGSRNVTVLHLAAIAIALEMPLPQLLRLAERRESRAGLVRHRAKPKSHS
jgi:transcriptional regulator with XRE-family HTH domain